MFSSLSPHRLSSHLFRCSVIKVIPSPKFAQYRRLAVTPPPAKAQAPPSTLTFQEHSQAVQELEMMWQKRYDDTMAEIVQKSCEITHLKGLLLRKHDEELWLAHNFNLHGVLKRIVFQATLEKKVGEGRPPGVQNTLNAVAELDEFDTILKEEIHLVA